MSAIEKYQGEYVPKELTLVGPFGSKSSDFEAYIREAFKDLKKHHPQFQSLNTQFYYSPMPRSHKGFIYFQTEAAANLFRGLTPEGEQRKTKISDPDWVAPAEKVKELTRLKALLPMVKSNPSMYEDPEKAKDWGYDVVVDYEDQIERLENQVKAPTIERILEPYLVIPPISFNGGRFNFEVNNLFFQAVILSEDDRPDTLIVNFCVNGTKDRSYIELEELEDWLSFFAPEDRPEIHHNNLGHNAYLYWANDPRGAVKYRAILGLRHFSNDRVALSKISNRLPPSPKSPLNQQRKSPTSSPDRRRAGTPRKTFVRERPERPRQEISLSNKFGALSC